MTATDKVCTLLVLGTSATRLRRIAEQMPSGHDRTEALYDIAEALLELRAELRGETYAYPTSR